VIKLNEEIELIYAFSTTTFQLVDHKENYGTMVMRLNEDGTGQV
jgi:hypothetical protein